MWSRLREVFARELVVLVDPTNPQHARRRKQLTASVGAIFTLGMAVAGLVCGIIGLVFALMFL